MIMAVEWTTATIIRDMLGTTNFSGIPDAEIEELIEQNEGFIETALKIPSSLAFDNSKKPHKIIRKLVSLLTCLDIVGAYGMSFITLDSARLAADIFFDDFERTWRLITDNPTYIQFVRDA